jgi:hypothetical protein
MIIQICILIFVAINVIMILQMQTLNKLLRLHLDCEPLETPIDRVEKKLNMKTDYGYTFMDRNKDNT